MNDNFPQANSVEKNALNQEEIERLSQHATWTFLQGDYEASLNENKEILKIAEKAYKDGDLDALNTILVSLQKISVCYENLGDDSSCKEYEHKITDYKDQLYEAIKSQKGDFVPAADAYSRVLLEDEMHKEEHAKEIVELLEPFEDEVVDPGILLVAYTRHAYFLDEENDSDSSLKYYEKAEKLARKFKLLDSEYRSAVITLFYNYGWVLWNRFDNEEAIIYYGKAIDLIEDDLNGGDLSANTMENLQHFAEGLMKLYRQTGKEKEADRLRRRLSTYGLDLKE